MTLQRVARRVMRRYGTDITGMVGGDLNGASFQFGGSGVGYSSGNQVTIGRQWWENASRRDRRGALVHELTHVATRNQGLGGDTGAWASNRIEQQADAVRLALTGKYGINPDTLSAARRIARNQGWLGDNMGTANGGPPVGNHRRNTLKNNASKSNYPNGYQAPVSSASSVGYGNDLASARYQYLSTLAALRAQQGVVKADYRVAAAGARANAVTGMVGVEEDALGRGVLGSSADLKGRAGVVAQKAQELAAAQLAKSQGRLDLGMQALDARNQYYMNVSGVQNAMAQEQQANSTYAFQNNLFDGKDLNFQDIRQAILDMKSGMKPRRWKGLIGAAGNVGNAIENVGSGVWGGGGGGYGGIKTPYGKPVY